MVIVSGSHKNCLISLFLMLVFSSVGHSQISEQKHFVFNWLDQPKTVAQFGKISDAIWTYAELGMQEFEDYRTEHPYKSFLPKDATPPLDINKELMDRYRALMQACYLGK